MPVVAIAVKDGLYDKMMSNVQQVKARKGRSSLASEGMRVGPAGRPRLYLPQAAAARRCSGDPAQFFAYHTPCAAAATWTSRATDQDGDREKRSCSASPRRR
jgi:glucosamine 6-phosphate synthetase-like amidotransferase/phosphosugar isomerase protein